MFDFIETNEKKNFYTLKVYTNRELDDNSLTTIPDSFCSIKKLTSLQKNVIVVLRHDK